MLYTGADFSTDELDVTFTPDTGIRQCFDVVIENDDILENTEVFHLSLLPTNDPAIIVPNAVMNVGIQNDDSKSLYISSCIKLYFLHLFRCDCSI